MTLNELLADVSVLSPPPESLASETIQGVAYDSRKVAPGFVFFAFPGANADGRQFAAQAMARGAVAVISELPRPG